MLLGIGPKADGTLPEDAVARLKEIGKWLNKNGEAIYNTRITSKYQDGNTYFTKNPKTGKMYALVCLPEDSPLPKQVEWTQNVPVAKTKITLLQTGTTVKWSRQGDKVLVDIPASLLKKGTNPAALAFSFIQE